jgi:hypothetical protein
MFLNMGISMEWRRKERNVSSRRAKVGHRSPKTPPRIVEGVFKGTLAWLTALTLVQVCSKGFENPAV